ncbi:hypothetical protein HY256_08380, partial [Candidatus Sumerlaeota bacterium]|nr:hypothetical protein [Candidatus Sumerlaeota bacterium]
ELIHFVGHEEGDAARPDWIVDVTERHEAKLRALRAYATQFYSPKTANKGPKTLLSSPEFWEAIETRAKRCGQAIGARYGEPFVFQHPPHANHAFVKMIRGN